MFLSSQGYYLCISNIESTDIRFHPKTVWPDQSKHTKYIVPAVVVASKIPDIEGHLFHKIRDVVVHVEFLVFISGVGTFEVKVELIYLVPAVVVRKLVVDDEMDEDYACV